jgi:hypothetical protein
MGKIVNLTVDLTERVLVKYSWMNSGRVSEMGLNTKDMTSKLMEWARLNCDIEVYAELQRRIGGRPVTEKAFWDTLTSAQAGCELKGYKSFNFGNLRCNS